LLKELIPSFFLGLLIFTIVLLTDKIMRIVEMIVNKGVPLGDVLKLFACLLPNFLLLTLPTALLLSVLVTFSRLCADNEFTAWRVAGVSLYQLLPPVYAFGIVIFSLAMSMSLWVEPASIRTFHTMMYSVATKHALTGLKERVFFEDFPGIVVYADTILPEQKKMGGIFIADQNFPPDPILYFAKEGSFCTEGESGRITITLKQGSIHRNISKKDIYQIVYFDTYTVRLRIDEKLFPREERQRRNEELTLGALLGRIHEKASKGESVRGDWVDFHNRLALPFACLVFCTLGAPLALTSQRAVRYTGFSLSIGVVLLYFILMKTGWGMAETKIVPPWLGPWIPNLVLGALGVYLLIQKAREAPIKILDWYGERVADVLDWVKKRLIRKEASNPGGRKTS
jgi:lipopolysaccharide export system permease protein